MSRLTRTAPFYINNFKMNTIEIYRAGSPLVTLDIDERCVYAKKLQGDHKITSEYIHSGASGLDLTIGDYIYYPASGESASASYTINRLPTVTKINNSTFRYNIEFEANKNNLKKKILISSDKLADFAYNGSPADFLSLILSNINEIDPTWTTASGTNTSGEDKTLQFVNDSCISALTKVAQAYNFEYDINDREIDLRSSIIGASGYTFRYGEASGLYKLDRQQVLNQNIITRCYGYGSTQNIPYTYRNAAKRLTFAASGMAASGYLQSSASGLYGIIEGQYTDDSIYPHRTGALTSVIFAASGTGAWDANEDYLEDSAMDFDVNDYLIEGQTAKIVFKSGDMSGVECEIWQYVDDTKRFYITPYVDTDGAVRPESVNYPASGDSYTLIGISMPQTYIDTAEASLKAATQAHLDKYSVPQVVYGIDIDPHYASGIGLVLNVGDRVTVVDSDLGIDSLIRISGIEFPLVNPYRIKASIADFVPYTMQEQIIKSTISNSQKTTVVDKSNTELSRRNKVNLQNQVTGKVAGWTINPDAIFSGTKFIGNGYSASGMTLAATGSIHARNFYINSDGDIGTRGSFIYAYTGVSDTVILSHPNDETTSNLDYTLVKTITLGANVAFNRTLRIKFTLASENGLYVVYGRLYKNGVAVGTERIILSAAGTVYSEDLGGWNSTDTIELWLKSSNVAEVAHGSALEVCGNLAVPDNEITGTNS